VSQLPAGRPRPAQVGATEEWNPDLLFEVPRDHPEIQRLEGRYKATGGVYEGRVVELSNGGMAMILSVDEDAGTVKMDANALLAGQKIVMELEIAEIVPPGGELAGARDA